MMRRARRLEVVTKAPSLLLIVTGALSALISIKERMKIRGWPTFPKYDLEVAAAFCKRRERLLD